MKDREELFEEALKEFEKIHPNLREHVVDFEKTMNDLFLIAYKKTFDMAVKSFDRDYET